MIRICPRIACCFVAFQRSLAAPGTTSDPIFQFAAHRLRTRVAGILLRRVGDDAVNGLIPIDYHGGIALTHDPVKSKIQ
ncbi:MAG: hypothetical protein KF711_14000 [Nitrospira sp.]|nr:hypothetical protein [Nitrospira sp.]